MNRRWCGGIVLVLALAPAAWAGSAPASLACKSQSAPVVTLTGWIPADEIVLDMKLTRGASTRLIQSEQGDTPHMIVDLRHQVFSMVIALNGGPELKLHAIPSTVHATIGDKGTRASFQALLTAPKPEHVGSVTSRDMLSDVPMSCTYDYTAP